MRRPACRPANLDGRRESRVFYFSIDIGSFNASFSFNINKPQQEKL